MISGEDIDHVLQKQIVLACLIPSAISYQSGSCSTFFTWAYLETMSQVQASSVSLENDTSFNVRKAFF